MKMKILNIKTKSNFCLLKDWKLKKLVHPFLNASRDEIWKNHKSEQCGDKNQEKDFWYQKSIKLCKLWGREREQDELSQQVNFKVEIFSLLLLLLRVSNYFYFNSFSPLQSSLMHHSYFYYFFPFELCTSSS